MMEDIIRIVKEKREKDAKELHRIQEISDFIEIVSDEATSLVNLLNLEVNDIFLAYIITKYHGNFVFEKLEADVNTLIQILDEASKKILRTSALDYLKKKANNNLDDLLANTNMDADYLLHFYKYLKNIKSLKLAADRINENDLVAKMFGGTRKINLKNDFIEESIGDFDPKIYQIMQQFFIDLTNKKLKLRSDKSTLGREMSLYRQIISLFEESKDNDFFQVPNYLSRISDKELKIQILTFIKEYNENSINKLKSMYNSINEDSNIELNKLFNNYGIDISKYDIELNMTLDDLRMILGLVNDIGIQDELNILSIIKATSIDHINTLYTCLNKNIISKEWLRSNLILFDPKATTTTNLLTNIYTISSYVSLSGDKNDVNNILLHNPEVIKNNLEILRDYNFISSLKNCYTYLFLVDNNLEKKLTLLIELGLVDNIKNDINILNYQYDRLKRLKLYDSFEEIYDDPYAILDSNNFFVSDNKVDDYLYKYINPQYNNNYITTDEFISRLKKYESDEYTYNIEGVLISKKKVDRALNKLEYISDKLADEILFKDSYVEQYELVKVHSIIMQSEKAIGKN